MYRIQCLLMIKKKERKLEIEGNFTVTIRKLGKKLYRKKILHKFGGGVRAECRAFGLAPKVPSPTLDGLSSNPSSRS